MPVACVGSVPSSAMLWELREGDRLGGGSHGRLCDSNGTDGLFSPGSEGPHPGCGTCCPRAAPRQARETHPVDTQLTNSISLFLFHLSTGKCIPQSYTSPR